MRTQIEDLDLDALDTITAGSSPKLAEAVCNGKVYPRSQFNGQTDADGVITADFR